MDSHRRSSGPGRSSLRLGAVAFLVFTGGASMAEAADLPAFTPGPAEFAVGPTPAGPTAHDIRPGEGVTEIRRLSRYLPALAGTSGDTPIYVLQGEAEGGTLLLLGGTHANEIAGVMAATLLVERGTVSRGTVLVIPHANNSAAQYNDLTRHPGTPEWVELTNPSGEARRFRYGSRLTAVEDQEPDPEVFVHPLGGGDPRPGGSKPEWEPSRQGRRHADGTDQLRTFPARRRGGR